MGLTPGVHCVAVTPFAPDEAIDEPSLRSLIDFYAAAGAAGALVLGVMGEADRLSDAERERVIGVAVDHAAGRLAVTAGISHQSTLVTAARARAAARAGVTAVMVAPPVGSVAGAALRDHFRRVADGLDAPVVVQDHPASSGVRLPVEFLASLATFLPAGSAVKLEDPPTPPKIGALRAATELLILGGLGGVSLLPELDAGADGTMTGFAMPEALVRVVGAHRQGEWEEARRAYEAALPLIVFEAQPGVGLAVRKEILRRQGVIASATIRAPAAALDRETLAGLARLLAAFAENTSGERDAPGLGERRRVTRRG